MRLVGPNFFIIGAAKAATSSLSSLLVTHPEAGIVYGKEPQFLAIDRLYQQGWGAYLELFRHCQGKKAVGDASTAYSRIRYHPAVVDRIKKHVPNARIIYMVRHPLKRIESTYVEHMCTPGGQVYASLADAIRRQPMIVDSSRYWEVFDAYRKRFKESKIKIIWFEEYVADTVAVFQDVCRFLEIDDKVVPDLEQERANTREYTPMRLAQMGRGDLKVDTTWDEETRRYVIDQLREDNLRFLAYFNRPRDYWGDIFG